MREQAETHSAHTTFTIIIPVYNEGIRIVALLDKIRAEVREPHETLVVYDSESDTTAPHAAAYAATDPSVRPLHNTYGRGPANAIRFGIDHSSYPVVVVTMSDGSDEVGTIPKLAALIRGTVVVGAASRYMKGGEHRGGPPLKSFLSSFADRSLFLFGRVGTRDATNAFKAYSKPFIDVVGIESVHGFELGIEMVAKARRHRLQIREVPTAWQDRAEGESHFHVLAWLPHYLRWYVYAFGPRSRSRILMGDGNEEERYG